MEPFMFVRVEFMMVSGWRREGGWKIATSCVRWCLVAGYLPVQRADHEHESRISFAP